MAFIIEISGEQSYTVDNRMEAMYHLGAKYGAVVYNQAVKEGFIKYEKHCVKVSSFKAEAINTQVNGLSDGYILK